MSELSSELRRLLASLRERRDTASDQYGQTGLAYALGEKDAYDDAICDLEELLDEAHTV